MRSLVLGGFLALAAALAWPGIVPAVEAAQARRSGAPAGRSAAPAGRSAAPAQGTQPLPGGANSLQEMHGDWRVTCADQNGKKVCALSQQQTDKDSHQLLLAVELNAPAIDKAEGTLILPFGLALERPVTLQIDDAAAGPTLRFRTCLPVGCLVSLAFDPKTVALLRKGTTLTVNATADGGQGAAFKISLNGFASALDRTFALAK
jgi:invasion protein IalB